MIVPLFNSVINMALFVINVYIFLLYIDKENHTKWFLYLKTAMALILIGTFWQSLVSLDEAINKTKVVTINDAPSILRNLGFLLNSFFFIHIYKTK